MGELRDSSLLFSLESLLEAERERVDYERREQERCMLEAQRAKQAEEQRRRDAERARLVAEERERIERERQQREEQARLAAVREAELKRAELEVAKKAEIELMARREEHERGLAAIRAEVHQKRARYWAWVAAGALFVAVAAPIALFASFSPKPGNPGYQTLLRTQQAVADEATRRAGEEARKREESERARQELERRLREVEQKNIDQRLPPPAPKVPVRSPRPSARPDCGDPSDPMNPCLVR
jgi:hypothetical protein